MRDLFVRWATRATRATELENPTDRSGFPGAADVAQGSDARATRATGTPTVSKRVAHVAHGYGARATMGDAGKGKTDKDFSAVLPVLPMLPMKMSEPERCSLADCMTLIRETFEAVAAEYVDGALTLLGTDPDLCRRFHATEGAIDAAVKARPTEHELRAALAAHVAVIREACQRRQAQRDAAAAPRPALPDDTALAVGVSYGDGKPDMWDVVRRAR